MTAVRRAKHAVRVGLARLALPFVPSAHSDKRSVCILTYHRVNDDPSDTKAIRTASFASQMRFLAISGIRARRLVDLVGLQESDSLTVCVTFDDGYLDNWRDAAPILSQFKIPATFFVTTGCVGTSHRFPWDIRDGIDAPMMSWDHVRALVEEGHEIGAHTRTHPDLGSMHPDRLEHEIKGSGDDIKEQTGNWPKSFAYPFGRWANISPAAAHVASQFFLLCCSAVRGRNLLPLSDTRTLRRVSVQPSWTAAEFRAELAGVFDFLERLRN